MSRRRRILVTGGAGFIGSNFTRSVIGGAYPSLLGAQVTVFDKLTYAGNLANLADVAHVPEFTFVHGDICDGAAVASVVPGHDVVVNFAAESHVDRSIEGAADFVTTNVLGTQRLLEAALAAGVEIFVQVSTDEVYGSIEEGSWDEDCPLLPNSPYSAAKASGDLVARSYHRTYGLDVRITRCSNNYGPFQFPEKVVPLFVSHLLDGQSVPLYGDGLNVRDWLHVDDHCQGIAIVVEHGSPGEIYNIGGGTELTNRDLTSMLLELCGRDDSFIEPVPDRLGHDRRYSVDDTKLARLGYRPRIDLAEGLAATVQWYVDHESWWRPLKARPLSDVARP